MPKFKPQTINEMIAWGASANEAREACNLYELLSPCLSRNKKGRFDTRSGDKTELGLYRTLKSFFDDRRILEGGE